jgi:hypothetical protein
MYGMKKLKSSESCWEVTEEATVPRRGVQIMLLGLPYAVSMPQVSYYSSEKVTEVYLLNTLSLVDKYL